MPFTIEFVFTGIFPFKKTKKKKEFVKLQRVSLVKFIVRLIFM